RPSLPPVPTRRSSDLDRRDADPDSLRICGMDEDGVQAEAAVAGEPFGARGMRREARDLGPRLAAVAADEESGLLNARVERVRLGDRKSTRLNSSHVAI